LATLAVMWEHRDNAAGASEENEDSSGRETVRKETNSIKYDTEHLSSGFSNIDIHGEERPQCLFCMKICGAAA